MTSKQIGRASKTFTAGLLGNGTRTNKCWHVCSPLCGYLGACGVQCQTVEGEVQGNHHYWIELFDGRIIDPTAEQFGLPNLWCEPRPEGYLTYTNHEQQRLQYAVKNGITSDMI